jgi:uncharacterized protein
MVRSTWPLNGTQRDASARPASRRFLNKGWNPSIRMLNGGATSMPPFAAGPMKNVFHLAIPCLDLEKTIAFYVGILDCRLARRYHDRVTLDFFETQVVCHLSTPDQIDSAPKIYPRHFGLTLRELEDFEALLQTLERKKAPFFAPLFIRFEGRPEEHRTFFLKDPANNLIEFKWYKDAAMMY